MHHRGPLANLRSAAHVYGEHARHGSSSAPLGCPLVRSRAELGERRRPRAERQRQDHASSTARGRFKLVTYNVAGLPDGVSQSHPSVNMGPIGRLLNRYDLVLVQEDFAYAAELRRLIAHPHVTPPFVRGDRKDFGDGLSQFCEAPACGNFQGALAELPRHRRFVFRLPDAQGVHLRSAWRSGKIRASISTTCIWTPERARGDISARAAQIEQLGRALERFSAGQAVIVAGDTNMGKDEPALSTFQARFELIDVCRKVGCPDPGRIDRVFYRSSSGVSLAAKRWRIDRTFVDRRGQPLSITWPSRWTSIGRARPSCPRALADVARRRSRRRPRSRDRLLHVPHAGLRARGGVAAEAQETTAHQRVHELLGFQVRATQAIFDQIAKYRSTFEVSERRVPGHGIA